MAYAHDDVRSGDFSEMTKIGINFCLAPNFSGVRLWLLQQQQHNCDFFFSLCVDVNRVAQLYSESNELNEKKKEGWKKEAEEKKIMTAV